MSGSEKAETLWTVEALEGRQEWDEVRGRASKALASMRWPNEPPPSERWGGYMSYPPEECTILGRSILRTPAMRSRNTCFPRMPVGAIS